MKQRAFRGGVAILAFAAVLALAVAAGAATSAADDAGDSVAKFQKIDVKSISKLANWKPASISATDQVTAIVQLSGDPVATREAEAQRQGRTLSKEEKARIRAELKAQQDALKGKVAGAVVADYQDAYNGFAVRVARKDIAALQALPGVSDVHVAREFRPDNTNAGQFVEVQKAWGDLGKTGTGVKVAVIDTGVDYLHANFGGPGTKAAFDADNHTIIEPGSFPTAKVVAGFDFVGDAYNASADDGSPALTPHPDPDPLDCNGHGSHVAGSAAGFGIKSDGTTFTGPWNASTYSSTNFRVGPGMAPEARVLAYRVFGCAGSTSEEIMVAAINRAVADGAQVINMSIGSPFGRTDEPSAVAADTAAAAGVVMVISAGNNGPNAYITGSPAAANRAISVAAIDGSSATFPGASMALSTGKTITAINANGATLPSGALDVVVLRNADGTVSLGCNPAEYLPYAGKVVVTQRGTCARVARAVFGQKAGVAAVVMINNTPAIPPFEGEITQNPDTGEQVTVTIPFLGVRGVLGPAAEADGDDLVAADKGKVTLTATTVANTGFGRTTSFSSGGPRNVDSAAKPDVSAPGQSVFSTGVGTGNKGSFNSGTSMASPMVAGVAALVRQAHPTWSTEQIKAAIMNTAGAVGGQNVRVAGTGFVNARRAVDSAVLATTANGTGALSYGYEPLGGAYSETLPITLTNTSAGAVTYDLSTSTAAAPAGTGIAFSANPVTVPAGGSATVQVTLSLSAAGVAGLPTMSTFAVGWGAVLTARGLVVATPRSSGAGIYPLRVPFMLVPRGLSNVTASAPTDYTQNGELRQTSVNLNNAGVHAGTADIYAWGISDANEVNGAEDATDVRAVGVQVLPGEVNGGAASDRSLVFAINNYGKWATAAAHEFDIAVDTKGSAAPEFFIVGVDFGVITTGEFDGRVASFIIDADGNLVSAYVAENPMNGSTILLTALASELGLDVSKADTKINYWVNSFSIVPDAVDDTTSVGHFRIDKAPVSTGDFVSLDPGQTKPLNLSVDKGKLSGSTVLGWLVVSIDDANGAAQADTIPIGNP